MVSRQITDHGGGKSGVTVDKLELEGRVGQGLVDLPLIVIGGAKHGRLAFRVVQLFHREPVVLAAVRHGLLTPPRDRRPGVVSNFSDRSHSRHIGVVLEAPIPIACGRTVGNGGQRLVRPMALAHGVPSPGAVFPGRVLPFLAAWRSIGAGPPRGSVGLGIARSAVGKSERGVAPAAQLRLGTPVGQPRAPVGQRQAALPRSKCFY